MGYPRLLYLNRAENATITSSTEDTGYPDDNAVDWREYLRWQASGANSYWIKADCGSQVTATSVALVGHNLNTRSARFILEASNDDSNWTTIQAYVTPSDDFAIARFFTSITYQYYRLTIDNNGGANFDLELGLFFVGNYIEFPCLPQTPVDPDRQVDHASRARGETGRLLGIAQDWTERRQTWTFRHLTQTWVSDTWLPFWTSYRFQPFIWVWDHENHADEVYLLEFAEDEMSVPYEGIWRHPLTLEMRGVKEE